MDLIWDFSEEFCVCYEIHRYVRGGVVGGEEYLPVDIIISAIKIIRSYVKNKLLIITKQWTEEEEAVGGVRGLVLHINSSYDTLVGCHCVVDWNGSDR